MKLVVCSVFDSKAGAFLPPFIASRVEVAQRHFIEALREPSNPMSKFPEDYILFRIGQFDNELGELVNEPHVNLGLGASLVAPSTRGVSDVR